MTCRSRWARSVPHPSIRTTPRRSTNRGGAHEARTGPEPRSGRDSRRNLSMVVSVVLVTFISLTFFGAAILLQMQIGQMKGYWYDRAQVAVYLCTDISPTAELQRDRGQSTDQIAGGQEGARRPARSRAVRQERRPSRIAQAGVRELQVKQFKGSALVDIATPDILPQSFRVNLNEPEPGRGRDRHRQGHARRRQRRGPAVATSSRSSRS